MANPYTSTPPGPASRGATGDAPPTPDTLKGDAAAAMGEAKDLAGKVAAEAGERASEVVDQAKAKVAETSDKVKGMAAEQKDLLADQIGSVAHAMARVADDLEAENGPTAGWARGVAENAGKLSDTIRNNDVDQIFRMTQDFGRRQPVAFLATAALLGFAASRFLTATAKPRVEEADTPYVAPGAMDGSSGASYDTRRM
jgi:hypothetical protein